ncbi:MAG: MFS transporter, partial [Clostridia bacterium]
MRRPKWWNDNVAQFLLAVSLAVMAGLYRDGFPALFPFMREEFGVSRAVLGMYVSVLYLISSVIAVLAGHVADRLGAKRALTWGTFALGTVILVHTWAPSFVMMLALAVLAGFGFSIISPGTNKVATNRFPPHRRGTPMSLV